MTKMLSSNMESLLMKSASRASVSVAMLTHMLLIYPKPPKTSAIGFRIIGRLGVRVWFSLLLDDVEVLRLRVHRHASNSHNLSQVPSQSRSKSDNGASAYHRSIGEADEVLIGVKGTT